jgi:hypothetical protein
LELCHGVLRLKEATAQIAQNLTAQGWQFAQSRFLLVFVARQRRLTRLSWLFWFPNPKTRIKCGNYAVFPQAWVLR